MGKPAKKPKTKVQPTPQPLGIGWRTHSAGVYRVWRSDWFSDQFELVITPEFKEIEKVCRRFSIPFTEAED